MVGFWGRSRREREQAEAERADRALSQRAATALVAADERLRLVADELTFARAELGDGATAGLTSAVTQARGMLTEAFGLHQLNVDAIPDTPEELRERNGRIVALAHAARDLLDEQTSSLEAAVAKVREAPAVVESVRAEAGSVRARLEQTSDGVARLRARYGTDAVRQIENNAAEARQLVEFANHSLQVAAARRGAGNAAASTVALEAATEGVRRAATLLDAVDHFEIEALRAESTLAAVVADSRSDLIAARSAPATVEIAAAAQHLQAALDALPAPGTPQDPFAELGSLRQANAALDRAIDAAREQASRPVISPEQVAHAVDDAERQLAVARDVISGHRGYIGADARTRLAEAERTLTDVHRLGGSADDRSRALALARRAADLAGQALRLAQEDIEAGRGGYEERYGGGYGRGGFGGGFGGPDRRGGDGMGGMIGGLLGGMVLGEILEDFFD